ncbi:SpoIIE family protein phosphatase [Fibrobacter sp. UWB7]|uniref:PP2C family protein-serine/threonine phosphatase n=1 Tax=Fibrobacter sp. UWB7 TaxID=1896206 RepID=UPI000915B623|nr:SpoIIE family protein phosphatase [Fibrobacter sp. UWB7]SHM06421.1 Cache domain-containing protein [Fibrobacter sp. UWB7]
MNTSRHTKIRSVTVLVVAALLLELTTAVQYISTRRAITAQIKEMAQQDLTSANRTFEVKEIAEAAIAAVLPEVERFVDTQQQDSLHLALQRVVANHPEIVGVDFAYRVGSDGLRDGYFTFRDDATNEIKDTVIGFDYTERTWYREGLHGNGSWSEPYMSRYYVALMSTFSRPVHDPQGRVVAVIGADVPMRELSSMAVQLYDNQQRSLIPVIIFQLIGLVVLGFIMYRSILSVRKLSKVSAEKDLMNRELGIANAIQTAMLPPPLPESEFLNIVGSQVPAKQVGGDFYDYFVRDGKLFFNIGDVCGKGIPAALVMSMTQAVFRTIATKVDDPSHIVMGMNTMASRGNTTGMFATLFVGVLDLATGRLSYCNAGHEKPIIITGRNMRYLDVTANIPIGVMEEKKYNIQETVIAAGDMILLYTDGLTEAMNANGKLFGLKRVESAICGDGGMNADDKNRELPAFAGPQQLLDTMSHAVSEFVNGAEQSDDLTMLVIKYKG